MITSRGPITTAFTMLLIVLGLWTAPRPSVGGGAWIGGGGEIIYIPFIVGKSIAIYIEAQAKGQDFVRAPIPPGKSAVYLYRRKRFIAGATIVPAMLDGVPLTRLQNGGYAVAIVEPGRHKLIVPKLIRPALQDPQPFARPVNSRTLVIETLPDQSVFIEVSLKIGWNDVKTKLDPQDESVALPEITETKVSEMPSPNHPLSFGPDPLE